MKRYYFIDKDLDGYWKIYFGRNTVACPEGLNDAIQVASALTPSEAIRTCERFQQGMSGTVFFVEEYPYIDAWRKPKYTVLQWTVKGIKYYEEDGDVLLLTKEEAEKRARFLNKITPKAKHVIEPYYFIHNHKEEDNKWSIYYGVNKYPKPEGIKLSTWENPLDAIAECEGLQNGEAGTLYYCRRLDGKEEVIGLMEPEAPWGIYKYDPAAPSHSVHVKTVKRKNPYHLVTRLIIEHEKNSQC